MYDLSKFTLGDMVASMSALKRQTASARSTEEAAQKIVSFFYNELTDSQTNEKGCALVRFYKTHAYKDLQAPLREVADSLMGKELISPSMKSLVLLASAGDKPAWNSRMTSANHKLIPLPTEEMVQRSPMIAQLITQVGLDVRSLTSPSQDLIADLADKRYNVFYVPKALGSPYIPAQNDFVIPYRIQSVLGFGGVLGSGDLFAVVLFSKVFIPAEVTNLFKTIAIDIKSMIMAFNNTQTFK